MIGRAAPVMVALALAGCGEENGPLDPTTIAALSRTRGDALGVTHTGIWAVRFEVVACTCPVSADLCFDPALLNLISAYAQVVEGDGFLTMSVDSAETQLAFGAELSGPINADGTASVGFVDNGFALNAELLVLGRMDGEFDGPDAFSGFFQQRAKGQYGENTVDCGADLDIDAERM